MKWHFLFKIIINIKNTENRKRICVKYIMLACPKKTK